MELGVQAFATAVQLLVTRIDTLIGLHKPSEVRVILAKLSRCKLIPQLPQIAAVKEAVTMHDGLDSKYELQNAMP